VPALKMVAPQAHFHGFWVPLAAWGTALKMSRLSEPFACHSERSEE